MKKYVKILSITLCYFFFGCEEEVLEIGPVPESFTKKVLIEVFDPAVRHTVSNYQKNESTRLIRVGPNNCWDCF